MSFQDKALDLFAINGDRKMSYLSLTNISCVEKDSWGSDFTIDPRLKNNRIIKGKGWTDAKSVKRRWRILFRRTIFASRLVFIAQLNFYHLCSDVFHRITLCLKIPSRLPGPPLQQSINDCFCNCSIRLMYQFENSVIASTMSLCLWSEEVLWEAGQGQ